MIVGKIKYKANVETGDVTLEQQIEEVKDDSIKAGRNVDRKFEETLKYDLARTVTNILGNAVISYQGNSRDPFCESLQRLLVDIYYAMHDNGKCYLVMGDDNRIDSISTTKGHVELIDPAYKITKITQKAAAKKKLEMYGVVTDAMYSVIAERGVMGVFSPAKDTVIKPTQGKKIADAFKQLFGGLTKQRKFAVTEVPMTYTGVSLPVAELDLLNNERNAVASIARIYGIQEDMILSGATFDNKENAIIQTYTDYKGLIYNWIAQIEADLIATFRAIDGYNVTFPGVPQMNKVKEGGEV